MRAQRKGIKLVLIFAIQPKANPMATLGLSFSDSSNGHNTYASVEPQSPQNAVQPGLQGPSGNDFYFPSVFTPCPSSMDTLNLF